MPKKNEIEKQHKRLQANIRKTAEAEIRKIAERVEKIKEEAEIIGEEIEGLLTEKRVKSRKSNTA